MVGPRGTAGAQEWVHHRQDYAGAADAACEAAAMNFGLYIRLVVFGLLIYFLITPETFAPIFAPLTKAGQPAIYNQGSLLDITLNHLTIVLTATVVATLIAV